MQPASDRQVRSAGQMHKGTHRRAIHVAPPDSDDGWLIVDAELTQGGFRFWIEESSRLCEQVVRGSRIRHIIIDDDVIREELCRAAICTVRQGRAQISITAEVVVSVSHNESGSLPRT